MKNTEQIERKITKLMDAYDERKDKMSYHQYQMLDWVTGDNDCPIDGIEATGEEITDEIIKEAIEKLKKLKTNIPEYSFFGDNNWKRIDSEVEILEWVLENA